MNNILKTLVLIVFFATVSSVCAQEKLKPRLGEPPVKNTPYIFVDSGTPAHILKSASEKKINFALNLKSSDAGWIRKSLDLISKGSLIVFVKNEMSDLEKKYLDELAKSAEYRITLICSGGSCEKNQWKHPLIKNNFVIEWKKEKGEEEIFMKSARVNSKGAMFSATDILDFKTDTVVKGALFFKEPGYSFVSLDEKGTEKFAKDAWIVVYYSKSEKKIKEFIEKKI